MQGGGKSGLEIQSVILTMVRKTGGFHAPSDRVAHQQGLTIPEGEKKIRIKSKLEQNWP